MLRGLRGSLSFGCAGLLAWACSSTTSTRINTSCSPGDAIECVGPGDCAGKKLCNETGSGFGECACEGAGGAGGESGAGAAGAAGAPDGAAGGGTAGASGASGASGAAGTSGAGGGAAGAGGMGGGGAAGAGGVGATGGAAGASGGGGAAGAGGTGVGDGGNCSQPASCKQVRDCGATTDGSYQIHPAGITAWHWCDMTGDGGGWTLIAKNTTSGQIALSQWQTGSQSEAELNDPATTAQAWRHLSAWDDVVGDRPATVRQVNDSGRKGFWVFEASASEAFSTRFGALTCESGDWATVGYHSNALGTPAHAVYAGSCGGQGILGTNAADQPYPNGVQTTFFANMIGLPYTGSAEDAFSGAHEWGRASSLWLREE